MKDKISINIRNDHTLECAVDTIGREGEGNTSRLEITIPEKLSGCSVYLDFEKPDGDKLRTPRLEIENGVAVYDVEPYLLTEGGEVKVQVVFKAEDGQSWKSSIKKYINHRSINAVGEIPEKKDIFTEMQKALDTLGMKTIKNSKRITKLEEGLSDDLFVTDSTRTYLKRVPSNVFSYAKINKIYGGNIYDSPSKTYSYATPIRVESCKPTEMEILDVTLVDTGESDTLSVEKTAEGYVKFNGYTANTSGAEDVIFAKATLSAGTYRLKYSIISDASESANYSVYLNTSQGTQIVGAQNVFSFSSETEIPITIRCISDSGNGGMTDLVIRFEKTKGFVESSGGTEWYFFPEPVAIASLTIPPELRTLPEYCLHNNYIDLDNMKYIQKQKLVDGKLSTLSEAIYTDIASDDLEDPYIKVVPNGYIRVITEENVEKGSVELTYMLEGVIE